MSGAVTSNQSGRTRRSGRLTAYPELSCRRMAISTRTRWTNAALFVLLAQYFHRMYIVAAPVEAMRGAVAGAFSFHGPFLALAWLAPFLFVLPAVWGARRGMRAVQLRRGPALLLAVTITILMAAAWTNNALWVFNWLLLCPTLYLVGNGPQVRDQQKQTSRTLRENIPLDEGLSLRSPASAQRVNWSISALESVCSQYLEIRPSLMR